MPIRPIDAALEEGMRADEAVRIIARRQLRAMLQNHSGTVLDLDPEFLHDLRVAVRRTRSLLTQVKGVLPAAQVEHFSLELSWLADATNECRDLDVILEHFDEYESVVWDRIQAGARALRRNVTERRELSHARMARDLGSNRFGQFVRDWRGFLHGPLLISSAEPNAALPAKSVARSRIRHKAQRIFALRGSIDETTSAKRLHQLRIQFKKLRYLIEFFCEVFPEDRIARAIEELKTVQDDLGALNDAQVHREILLDAAKGARLRDLPDEERTEAVMAAGELVQYLSRRIDARRHAFATDFERYTRPKNRRRYLKLTGS